MSKSKSAVESAHDALERQMRASIILPTLTYHDLAPSDLYTMDREFLILQNRIEDVMDIAPFVVGDGHGGFAVPGGVVLHRLQQWFVEERESIRKTMWSARPSSPAEHRERAFALIEYSARLQRPAEIDLAMNELQNAKRLTIDTDRP